MEYTIDHMALRTKWFTLVGTEEFLRSPAQAVLADGPARTCQKSKSQRRRWRFVGQELEWETKWAITVQVGPKGQGLYGPSQARQRPPDLSSFKCGINLLSAVICQTATSQGLCAAVMFACDL